MYQLVCLSTDGDKVIEGQFATTKEALNRSESMGSRWFFYPIHVVIGKAKIIDLPDVIETDSGFIFLKEFRGRHIKTLINFLKNNG